MTKSLAQIVAELSAASKAWMLAMGYCELVQEDGEPVLKITEAGYRYFASIEGAKQEEK